MAIDPQNLIGGGAGAFVYGIVHKLLSYNSKDFPPCNAIPLKEGRGFPWNKTILVHTTKKGEFTMKYIEGEKDDDK